MRNIKDTFEIIFLATLFVSSVIAIIPTV